MVFPVISGALNCGAGSPTRAAGGGTAVAWSTARMLIAARAATDIILIGTRIGDLRRVNTSTLPERVEHARRGQDLRQQHGFALAGVEQIERHAAAAELLQELGDFGVLIGPVALERNDAAFGESLAHGRAVECDALVDQTGDAPGSGQVDKDRLALGLEGRQPLRSEILVVEAVPRRSVCRWRLPIAGCQRRYKK